MSKTCRRFGVEINVLSNDQVKNEWRGSHCVVSYLLNSFVTSVPLPAVLRRSLLIWAKLKSNKMTQPVDGTESTSLCRAALRPAVYQGEKKHGLL